MVEHGGMILKKALGYMGGCVYKNREYLNPHLVSSCQYSNPGFELVELQCYNRAKSVQKLVYFHPVKAYGIFFLLFMKTVYVACIVILRFVSGFVFHFGNVLLSARGVRSRCAPLLYFLTVSYLYIHRFVLCLNGR